MLREEPNSGRGAAIVVRRRLILVAVVIVRRSWNLDVTFIMFEVLCTSVNFDNRSGHFRRKGPNIVSYLLYT
jgi:hypothetical protein